MASWRSQALAACLAGSFAAAEVDGRGRPVRCRPPECPDRRDFVGDVETATTVYTAKLLAGAAQAVEARTSGRCRGCERREPSTPAVGSGSFPEYVMAPRFSGSLGFGKLVTWLRGR